jgi:hypothetical protein
VAALAWFIPSSALNARTSSAWEVATDLPGAARAKRFVRGVEAAFARTTNIASRRRGVNSTSRVASFRFSVLICRAGPARAAARPRGRASPRDSCADADEVRLFWRRHRLPLLC